MFSVNNECHEYSSADESGFSAGCQLLIEGHEIYCPNNPDDPACTDFLHDVNNKRPPETGPLCGQEPSDPGCFKNKDPEKYCLNHDDQAFCKTIGDICDADGYVKPEDAYCRPD